ncbi:MAG: hypothetical protein MUF87_00300 [Anaerolineae bacterium]|jgi:hypothetical protein|nr:hypothetical protein [Anaerolineae bacterium]
MAKTQNKHQMIDEYLASGTPIPVEIAREAILNGQARPGMQIQGVLTNIDNTAVKGRLLPLATLPEDLTVDGLILRDYPQLTALPKGLKVKYQLDVQNCTQLTELPDGLNCYELNASQTAIERLPDDLRVQNRLDLTDCERLWHLPEGLKVGTLILRNCTGLEALPEGLEVNFLDISGCINLTKFPKTGSIRVRLNMQGCFRIKALPDWLTQVAQLNVSGCAMLTALPTHLHVTSRLDLAHTQITTLPEGARKAALYWRGVPVDDRIVFQPETIRGDEVLNERNAERRRVLLDRMGYEAFVREVEAQLIDSDTDPGGQRQLLRVDMEGDEELMCLSVICPSTARQYVIRVPPHMQTCHQAAAWIAGFDDPSEYRPLIET